MATPKIGEMMGWNGFQSIVGYVCSDGLTRGTMSVFHCPFSCQSTCRRGFDVT